MVDMSGSRENKSMFPCVVFPKLPNNRPYRHMHFLTIHTLPLLLAGEQQCQNRVGLGSELLKM